MCNASCNLFVSRWIEPDEITGKDILEAGALDVNGSVRHLFQKHKPRRYVGTDIAAGKGVDYICDAVNLVDEFGETSVDVLVSTEMLEHVSDWRSVVSNFKRVLKPGGVLFITTRSPGFQYHAYPEDHWRYTLDDMKAIFSEFEIIALENDPSEPGVFLKARKPRRKKFVETDMSDYDVQDVNGQLPPDVLPDGPIEQPTLPVAGELPLPVIRRRSAKAVMPFTGIQPSVKPLPKGYKRLPWDRRK